MKVEGAKNHEKLPINEKGQDPFNYLITLDFLIFLIFEFFEIGGLVAEIWSVDQQTDRPKMRLVVWLLRFGQLTTDNNNRQYLDI